MALRQSMMVNKQSKPGSLHKAPADLRKALSSDATAQAAWRDLTPLAERMDLLDHLGQTKDNAEPPNPARGRRT